MRVAHYSSHRIAAIGLWHLLLARGTLRTGGGQSKSNPREEYTSCTIC
jgi:hypothetical protein